MSETYTPIRESGLSEDALKAKAAICLSLAAEIYEMVGVRPV